MNAYKQKQVAKDDATNGSAIRVTVSCIILGDLFLRSPNEGLQAEKGTPDIVYDPLTANQEARPSHHHYNEASNNLFSVKANGNEDMGSNDTINTLAKPALSVKANGNEDMGSNDTINTLAKPALSHFNNAYFLSIQQIPIVSGILIRHTEELTGDAVG
ncbi:hypothetical protein EPH_0012500 [Eimeria praecox]|uniref:Uncharacterized protein n=1 Tax=Eimeria praecox TaxID=51316 RepID=U6GWL8_9EIME|nr:hypothetical protein EPH_0012500 [Eimeria praecox]